MHALLPAFKQAEKELAEQLGKWVHQAQNGELRFSAWKYRSALVQLKLGVSELEQVVHKSLKTGGARAQKLALEHLTHEVARFSAVFGDNVPVLNLHLAKLVATSRAALAPRYESSAERYAWGKSNGVWQDIQRRLAVEILKGSSVQETAERLAQDGGPRGMVTIRGVTGEQGAVVEIIPEGLFRRYRWRAEMFVRTELTYAYGVQMLDGLYAAQKTLTDLAKRWCTDGTGCKNICNPADGQVVALDENFVMGDGSTTDQPPAHPNCRCRCGAWRPHWGELLDSLGLN